METITLKLQGMRCASCAANIQKIVSNMAGVEQCEINFGTAQANIIYDPDAVNCADIQQAIAEAGYSSRIVSAEDVLAVDDAEARAREKEEQDLRLQVSIGGAISLVLVIGGLPMMTGWHLPWLPAWMHNPWLQMMLTMPVQFWCGRVFYVNALKAAKHHLATMDTLVALGTGAAYSYSVVATLRPDFFTAQGLAADVYFEASAVIITLVLLGKLLESRARHSTSEAIRKLIGLQPKTARVMRYGQEMDMAIAEVQVGDVVLLVVFFEVICT